MLSRLRIFEAIDSCITNRDFFKKLTNLSTLKMKDVTTLSIPPLNELSLRKINLSFSNNRRNIGQNPFPVSVEELYLRNCTSQCLNFNILTNLKILNLCKFNNPPAIDNLINLQKLKISTSKLQDDYFSHHIPLKTLLLEQMIAPNLNHLTNLTELHLNDIKNKKDKQNNYFSALTNLLKLAITNFDCPNIKLKNLEELTLISSSYNSDTFSDLQNLKKLELYINKNLRSKQLMLQNVPNPSALYLKHLTNLTHLGIQSLDALSLYLPNQLQFLQTDCPFLNQLEYSNLKGVGVVDHPGLLSLFTAKGITVFDNG